MPKGTKQRSCICKHKCDPKCQLLGVSIKKKNNNLTAQKGKTLCQEGKMSHPPKNNLKKQNQRIMGRETGSQGWVYIYRGVHTCKQINSTFLASGKALCSALLS